MELARADGLIIETLLNRSGAEATEALSRLRVADAECDRRFLDISDLWDLLGAADPMGSHIAPTAAEIIASVGRRTGPAQQAAPTGSDRRRAAGMSGAGSHWWGITAAAIACLLIGWAAAGLRSGGDAPAGMPAAQAVAGIATGPAEVATATLSDGTTVRLAPSSRLHLEGGPKDRRVRLEGHAFFDVAPDEEPFTVVTSGGEVMVLGTRFDLRTDGRRVQVAVVEGRVSLAAGGRRVEASAGEVGRAENERPPTVEAVDDLKPILAWLDGFLVFTETPLGLALERIEDRYGIRTELADPSLARLTVTARFTTEDPSEILYVVCRIVGARCPLVEGVARVSRIDSPSVESAARYPHAGDTIMTSANWTSTPRILRGGGVASSQPRPNIIAGPSPTRSPLLQARQQQRLVR